MLKKRKALCMLVIMGLGLCLSLFSVSGVCAATNPVLTIQNASSTEYANISEACRKINQDIIDDGYGTGDTNYEFLRYTRDDKESTCSIEIDISYYTNLDQEDKTRIMDSCLNGMENSSVSHINRNKIYNFIAHNDKVTSALVRQLSEDVNADFVRGYSYFKPFSGVLGIILGCLTLAIFSLLTIAIVWDLAYLTIPMWQDWLNTHNDKEKPKGVSLEAWDAYKSSENKIGSGEYENPVGLYFKKKSKQVVVICVCLLYLASGKIYVLLAQLMDAFSGMLPE